jgi:hypothetical protein
MKTGPQQAGGRAVVKLRVKLFAKIGVTDLL